MGLPADLPTFVKEADIVVDTLPLTAETRGMFDAAIFGAMKRTAFFVNVGRGGTVVTEALMKALQDGTIGGAGLDVVDPEPVPEGHPLWKTPRLILTPHVSADSDVDEDVRWLLIRENLRRFVAGGKMLSVVDASSRLLTGTQEPGTQEPRSSGTLGQATLSAKPPHGTPQLPSSCCRDSCGPFPCRSCVPVVLVPELLR